MSRLPCIEAPSLQSSGVTHAFFTRAGGVSTGVYTSLNGGVGSRDEPAAVLENRRRMAETLGVAPAHLLVPYQIHSADAVVVDAPFDAETRPRCDGLATATRGLALGVTGADCGVLLFSDSKAQVIGACHSGWKGALTGIVPATVAAMEKLGATRSDIHVVLGPTIGPKSYEVGAEFVARFVAEDAAFQRFFTPSTRADHAMFDLPAFIQSRVEMLNVGSFVNLGLDTYTDEERFFSYRRTTHRNEPDYGRLVAAIALV